VPCIWLISLVADFIYFSFVNAGGPVYGRLETCCKVENNIEDTMSSQGFLFSRQLRPQKPGLATAWKRVSTGVV
jgi:hypothetical protein